MEYNPWNRQMVCVGLDQDRQVSRQVRKFRVRKVSWPLQVEAVEVTDHLGQHLWRTECALARGRTDA
jgi:hypothetical protein